MNTRIYVNAAGTEFLKVTNDPNYQKSMLKNIQRKVNIFPELDGTKRLQKEGELLKIIGTLPIENQIELANAIRLNRYCDLPEYDLSTAKKQYQQLTRTEEGETAFNAAEFKNEFFTGINHKLPGLDQMFHNYSLSSLQIVLNYLTKHLDPKHWQAWQITGANFGEQALAWAYDPQKDLSWLNEVQTDYADANFWGTTTKEQLANLLFNNMVFIRSCNRYGEAVDKPEIRRALGGYYVANDNNEEPTELDDYMLDTYQMKPATSKRVWF